MAFRDPFLAETVPLTAQAFSKDTDHTEVTWLGGAGCLVNSHGTVIFVDPIMSVDASDPQLCEDGLRLRRPLPAKADDVPRVDYVLYTHADADHLGPITAQILAKKGARFIGSYVVYHKLTQLGVDPKQIDVYRDGETVTLGDILVELTPADHPWQLMRGLRPYRRGDCCGFILNTREGRIFFPGDTRLMEEHLKIKDIRLMALDVSDCRYHLGHVSAAILANNLPETQLLPVHYATYDSTNAAHSGDPRVVYQEIKDAEARGLMPAPGETVHLN